MAPALTSVDRHWQICMGTDKSSQALIKYWQVFTDIDKFTQALIKTNGDSVDQQLFED